MRNILMNVGLMAFAICGSCGLYISAVIGLVMVLMGSRMEEESE